jgi:hypothetical protein
MSSHLIYHPAGKQGTFEGTVVHFDATTGNQDPFIWNHRFLHTYCHMSQLRNPRPGDINFWVSNTRLQDFRILRCDLVFVVDARHRWQERNFILSDDPIVDSPTAYEDHYRWVTRQHIYKRRHRRTLKANPDSSFQPQTGRGDLLDIVPLLADLGLNLSALRAGLVNGFRSKPMPISDDCARALYLAIGQEAGRRIFGRELQNIRTRHPELASAW